MLIVLKFICFGLWFAMMMMLSLSGTNRAPEAGFLSLELHDPAMAEWQIYETLHQLRPDTRLKLTVSKLNPSCAELANIAACICRRYPGVFIQFSGAEGN